MTQVVNLRKSKYEVYIGRGSIYGNPFRIGPDGTRDEVIDKYRHWLDTKPWLKSKIRRDLKDKILGCFCKPLPCHGDVILEILNG